MIVYKTGCVFKEAKTKQAPVIIPHVCNDIGAWGAGFVIAISEKWKEPEKQYRNLKTRQLGDVQFIKVEPTITIANMIAQKGVGFSNNKPPIRYPAIKTCLQELRKEAIKLGAEIVAPKFGAGLAGGNWKTIEKIIIEELIENQIPVTICSI